MTSSAQNGNGVFSYGEGTVVNISDSTITTTADNSGGIQTTEGSTWTLTGNCTISSLDNQGTINYNGYTITLADGTILK